MHIPRAIIAFGLLAVLAVIFAVHERRATPARRTMGNVHFLSAGVIVLGLIVAGIGFRWDPAPIWQFQWVYIGEVIALLGFGFGWVVRGVFLLAPADPVVPAAGGA